MLGIKFTDKSIEDLFTRLISKISGNESYAHIFNNEVKEIYELFKLIHDNYLKAFTELRHDILVEGGEDLFIQSIEKMRVEKETERRILIARINSIVDDFSAEKKKYCDPFYLFFLKAQMYFITLNERLYSITEDLNIKIKSEKTSIAADNFIRDYPNSAHPLISSAFSATKKFAEYVQETPDKGLRYAVLKKGLESNLKSMRESWDALCESYVILEKRIKKMIRKGQL